MCFGGYTAGGKRDLGLREEGLLKNGKVTADPKRRDLLKTSGKGRKGAALGEPIMSLDFPL